MVWISMPLMCLTRSYSYMWSSCVGSAHTDVGFGHTCVQAIPTISRFICFAPFSISSHEWRMFLIPRDYPLVILGGRETCIRSFLSCTPTSQIPYMPSHLLILASLLHHRRLPFDFGILDTTFMSYYYLCSFVAKTSSLQVINFPLRYSLLQGRSKNADLMIAIVMQWLLAFFSRCCEYFAEFWFRA